MMRTNPIADHFMYHEAYRSASLNHLSFTFLASYDGPVPEALATMTPIQLCRYHEPETEGTVSLRSACGRDSCFSVRIMESCREATDPEASVR